MSPAPTPLQAVFDPTPEIFATDAQGAFSYPLLLRGQPRMETRGYDEVRLVLSLWHPSAQRTIDLDRAYVELRGSFDPDGDHWTRLAEIEPVVPPYGADSFDGWIVLPVFAAVSAFAVQGTGFEPRARLQIRASAFFVA